MVLSLAFILAFIGAGVALLIGIIIFSEVQADMLSTFPPPILISNGTAGGIATNPTPVYTCDSPSGSTNEIHTVDPSNHHNPTSSSTLVISGVTSQGCVGLAQHPITNVWYIGIRESLGGSSDNWLATVNPTTGVGTAIGNMNEGLNSIAFNPAGDLWAGANSQASAVDTIWEYNISTAVKTGNSCDFQGGNGFPASLFIIGTLINSK